MNLLKKIGVYILCAILFNIVLGMFYGAVLPDTAPKWGLWGATDIYARLGMGSLIMFLTNVLCILVLMPLGRYVSPILVFCVSSNGVYTILRWYMDETEAFREANMIALGVVVLFILCLTPYRMYKKRVDERSRLEDELNKKPEARTKSERSEDRTPGGGGGGSPI